MPLVALVIALVIALIIAGLGLARLEPDGPSRLRDLGFHGPPLTPWTASLGGVTVRALVDGGSVRVVLPLPASPVPLDRIARALGRGALLAELHALEASPDADGLIAPLPLRGHLRALRRRLEALARLAEALAELATAEGLVRWYLDRGGPEASPTEDPLEAFERVLMTFPDAPETLALCRLERDRQEPVAARARAHLAAREDPMSRKSNL